MGRIFEQGSDVDPILTHRVAHGLAGNSTKNSTWSKIVAWLNDRLQIPASQVTEETDLNFVTDDQQDIIETLETKQKIVNIGDWNMDSTTNVNVAHGVADYSKIRGVSVMIIDDGESSLRPLNYVPNASSGVQGGINGIGSTNITLYRLTGGSFDGTGYDSTSFNRGYVLIDYIP